MLGLCYFASNKYISWTCLWTKVLGTGTTYILSAQIFTQNSLRKSLKKKKKHSYLNLYFTTSGSDTVLLQSCIFQHIPLFYQLWMSGKRLDYQIHMLALQSREWNSCSWANLQNVTKIQMLWGWGSLVSKTNSGHCTGMIWEARNRSETLRNKSNLLNV